MDNKKAVIIGSGISGLACAIRLRKKGYSVTVYEAQPIPGGKIGEINLEGYRFDTGATYFTLPAYLEQLFYDAGYNLADFLAYERLPIVSKYFYSDGVALTAWADAEKFAYETQVKTSEPQSDVLKFLSKSRKLFEGVEKEFANPSSFKPTKALNSFLGGNVFDSFRSVHSANEAAFRNRKVQLIFDRYASASGSNPYKMPSSLNYIPHIEHNMGIFFPKGGMRRIVDALVSLCNKLGVDIQYNTRVDTINTNGNIASGIRTKDEVIKADIVVSNMDVHNTYTRLLPEIKYKPDTDELSNSVMVFCWGIDQKFANLEARNIFFSRYSHEEFDAIFSKGGEIFQDSTVYLDITSKQQPEDAPEGCENWRVMINVPFNRGQQWDKMVVRARELVLGKLALVLNENIQGMIKCEKVLTPDMIEVQTSAFGGAIYGNSLNSQTAISSRPPNVSSKIKNLYFCGGTVTPGGGIPFCLISAKNVSNMVP